jgi:hypothetical protein
MSLFMLFRFPSCLGSVKRRRKLERPNLFNFAHPDRQNVNGTKKAWNGCGARCADVPANRRLLAPVLSPDGKRLTMPLSAGARPPRRDHSQVLDPGGSDGKRSCPFWFVVNVIGPPISADELTRTTAPGGTPRCAAGVV